MTIPQSLRAELEKRADEHAQHPASCSCKGSTREGVKSKSFIAGAEACFELLNAKLTESNAKIEELAGMGLQYFYERDACREQIAKDQALLAARDEKIRELEEKLKEIEGSLERLRE